MKKDDTVCSTLEQVTHVSEVVTYLPHGSPGGWARFVEYVQEHRGAVDFGGWTVPDFFRMIIEYLLDGNVGTPYVCSQLYESTEDDTPAYKLSLYDLGFQHLDALDRNVQPSWFTMQVEPKGDAYTVILVPKRSLMKLIYRNLA